MITFTVVVVLAVLLLIVLRKLFAKPAPPQVHAQEKPVEVDVKITSTRAGDTVSVAGAGDEMSDLDFTVEGRNEYQLGQRRWIELRGTYRNRRVLLELSVEDEIEVYAVTDPARLTLAELALSEEDLGQLDERQNTSDFFEFEGTNWYYRFSREFRLMPGPESQGANFYGWLFREDGAKRIVLVKKAEGEPFVAVIGSKVNPADITVYRA
jgi:hypothetical protein